MTHVRVMTHIKAKMINDQPVTREALDQAIECGRRREFLYVATAVWFDPAARSLRVNFADGRIETLAARDYAELDCLSDAGLDGLTVGFGGQALCSDTLDLHLSIGGLLADGRQVRS